MVVIEHTVVPFDPPTQNTIITPYYYWSLMSVVMYVGIVCSVLVLMIMFTDTVCRFTIFLLVELLCPLIVVFTI